MPLEVKGDFTGIDQSAVHWLKHYLSPGTDVSLLWSGIPDSVSGDTYKYSNQFDFVVNPANLQYMYAYFQNYAFHSGGNGVINTIGSVNIGVLNSLDNVSFWRLPNPDMPGIVLYHSNVGYNIGGKTFYTVGQPVFDPNWNPTMARYYWKASTPYYTPIKCQQTAISSVNYPIGVQVKTFEIVDGFADNLTGYRVAGASVTVTNTSAKLYRNGKIVACSADTPLSRPYIGSTPDVENAKFDPSLTCDVLNSVDAPITYNAISSVKNYHILDMSEGVYVVLHNLQGEFLFRNPEIESIPTIWNYNNAVNLAFATMNTDNNIGVVMLMIVSGNNDVVQIPLVYNTEQHAKYYQGPLSDQPGHLDVPYPFIDPSSLSMWNSGFISFAMNDINNSLNLTFKINTYVECYAASHSQLKPNVSKSARFYPALIDYTSEFYSYNDGIYPADYNDTGAVWTAFKHAIGKVAKETLKNSPYYPVAEAGYNLLKDLFGGANTTKNTKRYINVNGRRRAIRNNASARARSASPSRSRSMSRGPVRTRAPSAQPKASNRTYADAVKKGKQDRISQIMKAKGFKTRAQAIAYDNDPNVIARRQAKKAGTYRPAPSRASAQGGRNRGGYRPRPSRRNNNRRNQGKRIVVQNKPRKDVSNDVKVPKTHADPDKVLAEIDDILAGKF